MNPIIELRKKHGWSQKELAEMLSVHQTAVSQWETGKTFPDILSAQKLALIFGVYMEDLLENSEYSIVKSIRPVSDNTLKLALFGRDVDSSLLQEIKNYAKFLLIQQEVKNTPTLEDKKEGEPHAPEK